MPYEKVAEVMSAAQAGDLTKIGFVTQHEEQVQVNAAASAAARLARIQKSP
ncbi:MAG: Biopolymer transport protein ExbD/TolR [uncultured Paraburkholderia sp.]|nr:MAG: Biopolymer transport protein ExbD/TolR [uncultured Paraburkholderia sp.]CAH2936751.1 MAG: Biopolymer transport protein ExbD/TolR [uncultured Paraburkholderia sp.]